MSKHSLLLLSKLSLSYPPQYISRRAKILDSNTSSLALFQQLGFVQTKVVPIFSEVHLELNASDGTSAHTWLQKKTLLQVHTLQ
jgi:L-amino acid N-acyltransferase YncA